MPKLNKPKTKSFQDYYELVFMHNALRNFDPENSQAVKKLTERFGRRTQSELLSLAQIISEHTEIKLYRESKRRRNLLLAWYEQNFDTIWPFIEQEVIVQEEKEINYSETPAEETPSESFFDPLSE